VQEFVKVDIPYIFRLLVFGILVENPPKLEFKLATIINIISQIHHRASIYHL